MWISSAEVGAVNYYVSPSGSDSGPGTSEQPFETIQTAADVVVAGDTVIVKDGTYTDINTLDSVVFMRDGGTPSNWITFRAENKHKALLDGENQESGFCLYGSGYIRIEGFEIKNVNVGVKVSHPTNSTHDIYVYECKIHNIGRNILDTNCTNSRAYAGITGRSCNYNITVDSCEFYDIGRQHNTELCVHDYKHDHAIYAVGKNWLIKNNIIYNMYSGWAIKVCGHEGATTDPTHIIVNNTFAHDANEGPYCVAHIIYYHDNGIDPHDIILQNNIFYDPPNNDQDHNAAIRTNVDLYGMIMRNNVTSADNIYTQFDGAGTPTLSDNIVNLPLADFGLTDPENNDFTLTSSATYLIDNGIAIDSPDYDYAGTSRPYGNGYDIGAYEFTGAAPSLIDQTGWSLVYVDSEETGYETVKSFDGDPDTIWHTEWFLTDPDPCHPHEIQIDLGGFYDICGFRQLPRQGEYPNGMIKDYEFYVSSDGVTWGTAVASGTFADDKTEKQVSFDCILGRYVRLVALSEINDGPWTSIAELNVLAVQPDSDINDDGKVNIEDFAVLAAWWDDDDGCVEPDWCGGADFDISGVVDMLDFTYFAENWLRQTPGGSV